MNHTAFFAGLKAESTQSLYLMEGTEEYIKQQALRRLCEKLLPQGLEAMNLTELENPDANALAAAAETLPFMGDKRVVVVRECGLLVSGRKAENETQAEKILDYLQRMSSDACLVFYVKGKADKRKKLYTFLQKQNAVVSFEPMSDAEAAQWAQRTMRAAGKLLDAATAGRLIFTVGRDAAMLKQEMDKLAHYVCERETITAEDIDAVCTKSLECTVFQLVDAQVAGKNETAFRLLADMERSGAADPFGIVSMLLRQYRILYHMRCLLEERVSQQSYASLLGIPPFAVSLTQQQARRYGKQALKAAYTKLLQMEYGFKSGQLPREDCAGLALLTLDHILRKNAE